MLYLLGIDHLRLTYRSQGRDFRLTDVAGKVVKSNPGLIHRPTALAANCYNVSSEAATT